MPASIPITSSPPRAEIEIAGMAAGNTAYQTDYLGSYFHKPHTVFGSRLEHGLTLKPSMGLRGAAKAPGWKTWERGLEVLPDSHLTLRPTLDPLP